ncbi:MAG: hypothetical protein WEA58_03995 [Balneolaceae bacterium]
MSSENTYIIKAEDSDQYIIKANITRHTFASLDSVDNRQLLLNENKKRVGFTVYNDSPNSIYVSFSGRTADKRSFSNMIGADSEWEPPVVCRGYTGEITFNPVSPCDGAVLVTEFIRIKQRGDYAAASE